MAKSKCVSTASAVLILSGVFSACAVDPSVDDAKITAQVKAAIAQHPDLGPPNQINVDTRSRVVYLTGEADNSLTTAKVPGVISVVSNVGIDK